MNILLINPPRSPHNNILAYASPEAKPFIHKKLIGPPLGLLTVASAVKDHNVVLLDMKAEYDLHPHAHDYKKIIGEYLQLYNPEIVGITCITSEFNFVIEIGKTIKQINPHILTVVGGLHATLCPRDFENQDIDIVCPGQAAHTFREIVRTFEKKKSFHQIGNIFINTKEGLQKTTAQYRPSDITGENFIMPERSYIKKWINTYRVGKSSGPATYIYTTLGCPHRCSFCSIWPQFKGQVLQRDVESIIHELKLLNEYPVVRFADAHTLVNLHFINKLFDRIKEESIKKFFIMDIRADTAAKNPKLIKKLAKGGLKVVITGFESFREDELKIYQKGFMTNAIKEAIKIFHTNGILVRGNYVISPEYDNDDFKALAEYAYSHKVVYPGFTIVSPMPGTIFYSVVKDQIIDYDLSKYNFFNCVLKTKLPLPKFYKNIGHLWTIKEGEEVI